MPEDVIAPVMVVLSTLMCLKTGPGLRSEGLRFRSETAVVDIHRWQAAENERSQDWKGYSGGGDVCGWGIRGRGRGEVVRGRERGEHV